MTSSELMYWEEIADDILKGWKGAGPDVDIDAIEELRESIRTANLAQDVIDLGTPEEAENLADILRRHMTTIPDRNMGEARDVQGLVEIIENALQSEGTWVSITLEERGYMLEDGPDDLRGGMRTGKQPSRRGGGNVSKKGRGPKPALSDQDYFKALRKLSPKKVRELAKEAGVDVSEMDHRQLMRSLSAGRPRPAIPNVPNSKIYVKPRSAPGQPVGGARSRMRAAATDRAATPQGLASRRRKLGYDARRQPGSADGHIWDQLTPEQRELVAESAAERANWLLRRNFGTGDPGKGGGWLTRHPGRNRSPRSWRNKDRSRSSR
ncbi:MAG TPA: hypothetical protein EYQ31_11270 [Candidatus Handelsmanbacteria bacterium]|nr:hypothetical protein [Candidatus Handelsmanbacteria bacterium]